MGRYRHYTKKNVNMHEYVVHKYIYDLNIVNTSRIVRYNLQQKKMTLEHIGNDNISNVYGDLPSEIPDYIFAKIREIILKLYDNGILYPDITGYNFIEHKNNGKVYILDFEHVTYVDQGENDFVTKFLNGYDGWNPEFC